MRAAELLEASQVKFLLLSYFDSPMQKSHLQANPVWHHICSGLVSLAIVVIEPHGTATEKWTLLADPPPFVGIHASLSGCQDRRPGSQGNGIFVAIDRGSQVGLLVLAAGW